MPKLLQINSVINAGSTGRIAEEIGQIAIDNGWESYIAFGRNDRPSKSQKIRIGNDLDIYLHVAATRILDKHAFFSRNATKKLIQEIERINPDVIHLHNLHGYYLNIEVLFNYLKDYKGQIYWTLYDCWALTGHCAYFNMVGCDRWKTACFKCPQPEEYPKSYTDRSKTNFIKKRYLFNLPTNLTIVVHSQWLYNNVKLSFLKERPIVLINNGVNLNNFQPQEFKGIRKKLRLENKFVILGVANIWDKRKGLDDILQLSKYLKNDEYIVIDGDPSSLKGVEEKYKNVIVHERAKSVEELATLYSMADVFMNPTHDDNFPTTNLEALACGTPVITYDVGGSPEAVDENTGFVVKENDIEGIAKCISIIKEKTKEAYSKNCRDRALIKFNYVDRYQDYIKLFNENLK